MGLAKVAWMPVAVTVIAAAMGCTTGTASAMVCNNDDGIGPITERVDANVKIPSGADCTFGPEGLVVGDLEVEGIVKGNIKVNGGTVTIHGTVDGNIEASKSDMITVTGIVHGNIKADSTSRGQIKVDGTVDGNVIHEGSGAIEINGGSVGGNIDMKGSGNVAVNDFSTVDGNIKSEGGGSVDVDGSSTVVDGDVQNPGGGPCTVDLAGGANVDGNLEDNCVDG